MEYHEIGERFECDGVMLEVKEGRNCKGCYFYGKLLCNTGIHREMFCHNMTRNDGKRAYYKLVEQCKPKDDEKKDIDIKEVTDAMTKYIKETAEEYKTPPPAGIKTIPKSQINKTKDTSDMAGHTPSVKTDTIVMNDIIDKLKETLFAKNEDYGNAFSEMFDELGIDYAYGKLREKMNRIKVLRKQPNMVENEGLEDALLDTAGYAILTLVELKKRKE